MVKRWLEADQQYSTGARNISVEEYFRRESEAEKHYDIIRSDEGDIKAISITTGWRESRIQIETENEVIYRFGPNEVSMGKIKLDKRGRMFSEIEPVPNAEPSSKFYFDRAAQRLARCLMKEGGQFPERTSFES